MPKRPFYLTDPDETDEIVFYAELSDDNNWLDTLSFTTEDTQTIVGFNVNDYQNVFFCLHLRAQGI